MTPPLGSNPRPKVADPHIAAKAPRRRGRTGIIIAVIVVLLLGLVWWKNHRQAAQAGLGEGGGGRRGGRGGYGANMPLPVGVYTAAKGDIHVYLSALGTVTSAHAATIRTQISGQLQDIAFQEGQLVHQGDLLAIIDPRPFENALATAQAQLVQAQAQLRTAQADLQRYETLAKEDSISKQQVDVTRAQVSQYEGAVQVAEAAIATANLNLMYCHIKAPFDGRVGLRQVDTGNYVTPGDANGLVVLTQTKPISVIFTLPEDQMATVSAAVRKGEKLPVDAFDRSRTAQIAAGVLLTTDNQIDPTTGTFKLRAEFTNEDEALFPNQFVNIQLLVNTIKDAVVIPTSAVERGQQGTYIYVITPEQTATARPIKLGANEGERVQVVEGLAVGDRIVTDGADRLKDGQKVTLPGDEAGASYGGAPGARQNGDGVQKGGPDGGKKYRGQRKKGGGDSNAEKKE